MKRFHTLLSLFCAALLLVSSARAQEKFELRLSGAVGERYLVTIATDDRMTEVYSDEKNQTRLQTRATAEIENIEPRKDGAFRLKMTYRQMAVTDNSDGQITRYDSQRDAKSADPMATMMNAMIGQSLTAVMNSKGKVLAIEGIEEFKNRLISALKLPKAEQEIFRQALKDGLSAEKLADAVGSVFLPEKPVAIGGSWQRKFTRTDDLFSVQVLQTSTLKEYSNNIFSVDVQEKITADPKTKVILSEGSEMRYQLSGHGKSTIRIDGTSGQSLSQTAEQRLSGNLAVIVKIREGEKDTFETVLFPVYVKITMQIWAKKLEPNQIDAAEIAR